MKNSNTHMGASMQFDARTDILNADSKLIYFDSAATSFYKPKSVAVAMFNALSSFGNPERGTHAATLDASRSVFEARMKLAKFFGVNDPSRIAFTNNATESINIAVYGLLAPGDHVVTTALEHNSVLRPLYTKTTTESINLNIAGLKEDGSLDYEELYGLIKPETKAVFCTHSSNVIGSIVNIKSVAKVAHSMDAVFIVDASQTVGVLDIDVEELGIDILCFSGHKSLLGPQGIGGIYVRDGIELAPLKSGGTGTETFNKFQPIEMPTHLEAGTLNGPGIAGLAAGIDFLNAQGFKKIRDAELELTRYFYDKVKDIPAVKVFSGGFQSSAICSLNIGSMDSALVSDILSTQYNIATRPGGHCAPLVHRAFGTEKQGMVRFSFSFCNTKDQIDIAIRALEEISYKYNNTQAKEKE